MIKLIAVAALVLLSGCADYPVYRAPLYTQPVYGYSGGYAPPPPVVYAPPVVVAPPVVMAPFGWGWGRGYYGRGYYGRGYGGHGHAGRTTFSTWAVLHALRERGRQPGRGRRHRRLRRGVRVLARTPTMPMARNST